MKAVDIVLLLPEQVEQEMIEINQSLQTENQSTDFVKEGSLPHISLCMLVLDNEELEDVIHTTGKIAKNYKPIHVVNEELHVYTIKQSGKIMTEIKHTKTPEFYSLHKDLMNSFQKFGGRKSDTSMFHNPSEVEPISCTWVDGYFTKTTYEDFCPHISLGTGTPTVELKIKEFTTARLAVCHFGNYCTVREIFAEFQLGS